MTATTRRVTRNFQITLPRSFRQEQAIEEGDMLEIFTEGNKLILRPLRGQEDVVENFLEQLEQDQTGFSEKQAMDLALREIKTYRQSKSPCASS